jgi:hypothetical protein
MAVLRRHPTNKKLQSQDIGHWTSGAVRWTRGRSTRRRSAHPASARTFGEHAVRSSSNPSAQTFGEAIP